MTTATATRTLTLARATLLDALQRVVPGIPNKPTIAILGAVLVTTDAEGIVLLATSIEQTATARLPLARLGASIEAEDLEGFQPVAIPAKRFLEFVSTAGTSTVTLAVGDGDRPQVVLFAGRSRVVLPTMPAREFPRVESAEGVAFPVDGRLLATEIHRALQHVASDAKARPALAGVLLDAREEGFFVVGAENSLYCGKVPVADLPVRRQCLLPAAAAMALAKAVQSEESAWLTMDAGRVRVEGPLFAFDTALVGTPYPNYRGLMRVPGGPVVRVSRAAWRDAIRRVRVVQSATEPLKVAHTITRRELAIAATTTDSGRANDAVECLADGLTEATDGMAVAFTIEMVAATLDSLSAEDLLVQVGTDTRTPVVLRDASQTAPSDPFTTGALMSPVSLDR